MTYGAMSCCVKQLAATAIIWKQSVVASSIEGILIKQFTPRQHCYSAAQLLQIFDVFRSVNKPKDI